MGWRPLYLCGRQHSQFGICTWGGGGPLASVGGRRGSIAMEVLTSLHIEESREGVVLEDSTEGHDIWS